MLTKSHCSRSNVIEDKNGNLLTEVTAVLDRWTEYCKELYNYNLSTNASVIDWRANANNESGDMPIMRDEVEEAVRWLRTGKSPGVDNIPAEL